MRLLKALTECRVPEEGGGTGVPHGGKRERGEDAGVLPCGQGGSRGAATEQSRKREEVATAQTL